METILNKYSDLKDSYVSRENCIIDFEKLISLIIEKNKEINLISTKKNEKNEIRTRHIIDSAQITDFIDLNANTTCDLGSGSGMPGIVIAIIIKNLKKKMKLQLYEKSYHKSLFLREVSRKLELNTEIIQEDIFSKKKISSDIITSRAFKPLPVVLELVNKNFINYKNLILFMGKTGRKTLDETLLNWEFDYEEKKSITNENSFLLNITNIKKKK